MVTKIIKIKKSLDLEPDIVQWINDEAKKEKRAFQVMATILLEEAIKARQGK